jgi:hypothetical protein
MDKQVLSVGFGGLGIRQMPVVIPESYAEGAMAGRGAEEDGARLAKTDANDSLRI